MNEESREDTLVAISLEKITQALKETKTDPWMTHIPLPRVTEILAQSVALSFSSYTSEKQERLIVPLCIAASDFPQTVTALLSQFPSESTIWDILAKSVKEEKCLSDETLVLIYSHRSSLLEKHLLESLHDLGHKCVHDLSVIKKEMGCNETIKITRRFLGHICFGNFERPKKIELKYRFLPSVLASNEQLFNSVFAIVSSFLVHCKYSIVSIKVVKLFTELLLSKTKGSQFWFCEIVELLTLICSPPCIQCNDLLASNSDLDLLVQKISSCLERDCYRDSDVRTILCMNCEWLVYCKSLPVVRTLFLNIL